VVFSDASCNIKLMSYMLAEAAKAANAKKPPQVFANQSPD
jgi:hypothetical protein